jgi:UV DNA damage endonuclease
MVKVNLGLVCINTILRERNIFCSRTCIRKNFTVDKAMSLALQNVADIAKMLDWNFINGIKCLRLSSDIFPHFTDTETTSYTIDFARDLLAKVGALANKYGIRIVMHPSQFNQVGAVSADVFDKTVRDLAHHAEILDAMNISVAEGVMIVHGGGVYSNRVLTTERWIRQFHQMPDIVKRRLVIENCERSYNTDHVLAIARACNIPVVFDFHHYRCWDLIYAGNPEYKQRSVDELFPEIIATWKSRGCNRILMHMSEQDETNTKRIGAHSDYIENLPDIVFTYEDDSIIIDLEIEAKMKEQAILRLHTKYPILTKPQKLSIQLKCVKK